MNSNKEINSYPLKIIEMENFFLISDELINEHAYRRIPSANNEEKCHFVFEKDTLDLTRTTIVFIDSNNYRSHFEKSHLRLMSNMIVFDRLELIIGNHTYLPGKIRFSGQD